MDLNAKVFELDRSCPNIPPLSPASAVPLPGVQAE